MLALSSISRVASSARLRSILWRAPISRSLTTSAYQPSTRTTGIVFVTILSAAISLYAINEGRTLLDTPHLVDLSQPKDDQEVIHSTYVKHMNDLRKQQRHEKFYTTKGDVIRFHGVQHASNSPCEDEMSHDKLEGPGSQKWAYWSVLDGHAGGATSKLLNKSLITEVAKDLLNVSSEDEVDESIKATFRRVDQQISERALAILQSGSEPSTTEKEILAQAYAGSCALLAILDPVKAKLRVAVTGDSRAVLGRFSPENGSYVALPMSIDQNGKNPVEKARIDHDHPGEDKVINPRSGRVLGLAISRAFGDCRWKWSEETSLMAHEKFGGPRMRGLGPPGSVKTPPYLTAEPEIMETSVALGPKEANADFWIMASDGFWDHMNSEDAVTCVSEWVRHHVASSKSPGSSPILPISKSDDRRLAQAFGKPSPLAWPLVKGTGIWGDWRMKPEDFIYEEHNAATHLVQNAFGGASRSLFCGAMSEKYPLSRHARDDISVYVIFFGKVHGKSIVDEPMLRVV